MLCIHVNNNDDYDDDNNDNIITIIIIINDGGEVCPLRGCDHAERKERLPFRRHFNSRIPELRKAPILDHPLIVHPRDNISDKGICIAPDTPIDADRRARRDRSPTILPDPLLSSVRSLLISMLLLLLLLIQQ